MRTGLIAKKLGIASSKKEILTGEDLSKLGTSSLTKIINKYSVFATSWNYEQQWKSCCSKI